MVKILLGKTLGFDDEGADDPILTMNFAATAVRTRISRGRRRPSPVT
jgi:hypothetical protein